MIRYHNTILVVDDDAASLGMIERAFRAIGVRDPIHTMPSVSEAMAYMKGEGKYSDRLKYAFPSFITTDLRMPELDGFALLAFLKGNPDWDVIPTVVLSNSKELDDIKKAYLLGASSYHIKPTENDGWEHLLKLLHNFWLSCELPDRDKDGHQLLTDSTGKLGERFN